MSDLIETTAEEVTVALDKFERGKSALFRPDGTMKYSEAEHNELLIGLTERLHGVAERHHDAAEAEVALVQRLQEAEHDDPTMHLTPAELQLANARSQFVREDAMGLPLPQLLTRLRGIAAASGGKPDKTQAFLWSRYAHQRLESEAETAQAAGKPLQPAQREQLDSIDAEVSKLRAVIAPASGIDAAEARRRVRRARDAQRAMHARVSEVDGSKEALLAAGRARYSF
jgi:hypothetical protein